MNGNVEFFCCCAVVKCHQETCTRARRVRCQSMSNRSVLPDEQCSGRDKPRFVAECDPREHHQCHRDASVRAANKSSSKGLLAMPLSYGKLVYSSWSRCSASKCGAGTRERTVACQSLQDAGLTKLPVEFCGVIADELELRTTCHMPLNCSYKLIEKWSPVIE